MLQITSWRKMYGKRIYFFSIELSKTLMCVSMFLMVFCNNKMSEMIASEDALYSSNK